MRVGLKKYTHTYANSTLTLCMQENEIENEEENFDVDTPARSSRALEWEALGDDEETSYEFDITFDANTTGNLYENTRASSGKETRDLSSKTASSTLGRNRTIVDPNLHACFNVLTVIIGRSGRQRGERLLSLAQRGRTAGQCFGHFLNSGKEENEEIYDYVCSAFDAAVK